MKLSLEWPRLLFQYFASANVMMGIIQLDSSGRFSLAFGSSVSLVAVILAIAIATMTDFRVGFRLVQTDKQSKKLPTSSLVSSSRVTVIDSLLKSIPGRPATIISRADIIADEHVRSRQSHVSLSSTHSCERL